MNVRLFVSSVFTDCQRDLLDALQGASGRAGQAVTLHIAFVVALAFAHTHTGTQRHALRVYSRTAAHTHARTLAYAERQKLLHTLRKLTAFPFLARMQNNRIATSRALLRLTSPHLTRTRIRTVPLRTIPLLPLLCDLCRSFTFSFYILQLGMTLFLCCRRISFIHLPRIVVIVLPLRLIPFHSYFV